MLLKGAINAEKLIEMIDQCYDEIFIWDKNGKIVYVNDACYRHYGIRPEKFLGKTLQECTINEKLWSPSCVTRTFDGKRPMMQKQKTFLGIDIVTISVPIMDEHGEVEYVLQSVRDSDDSLYKVLASQVLEDEQAHGHESKIIYQSKVMEETLHTADKIAKTKAPVLILGETGTGKSLLAKYIHENSTRAHKPFVCVNIASLSPTIIESELFGYQSGAFTGAQKGGKKGLFEAANGGTLFLDEIGELPYDLQAKFLHTLQEEVIMPVGSQTPIKLDVRIICATNCDLRKMVEAGKFREDLYHRINVFDIMIPPLRKRQEDIEPLAVSFLNIFNQKYERNIQISERVMELLQRYPWKGNIRELSNVIERGVLTAEKQTLEITNLPESFFQVANEKTTGCSVLSQKIPLDEAVAEYEKKIVTEAFAHCKSSRKMAECLQISQTKANRLIQKYITKTEK